MRLSYPNGLELTDSGFDFSVLSEFRTRLVQGAAEHLLLDALLEACTARGYLKARGQQRTDSTHVLGALRLLSRLERVAETLRAVLNGLAAVAPDWLRRQVPPDWFERYGRRIEEYRLPRGQAARLAYAAQVGTDGQRLLDAVAADDAPKPVRTLPQLAVLRQVWDQQYSREGGQVRFCDPKALPASAELIDSPYELEARYATKGQTHWVGYKVHVIETCDEPLPHLITQVETMVATVPDVVQFPHIQDALAARHLLPNEHLVDAGYPSAETPGFEPKAPGGPRGTGVSGPWLASQGQDGVRCHRLPSRLGAAGGHLPAWSEDVSAGARRTPPGSGR